MAGTIGVSVVICDVAPCSRRDCRSNIGLNNILDLYIVLKSDGRLRQRRLFPRRVVPRRLRRPVGDPLDAQ
eukprot:10785212-Alexandrium_andersonii.AAC.1